MDESCMLALFHRRSIILSLLVLLVAAVYYQVSRQGLVDVSPTSEPETMAARASRSVIQTVFASEQAEVGFTAYVACDMV